MERTTIDDLKHRRLAGLTTDERAEFDAADDATRLAIEVGEQIRDAREEAGLSQRDLAARMGSSQAAVARLEAGGVGSTLTTLHSAPRSQRCCVGVDRRRQSLRYCRQGDQPDGRPPSVHRRTVSDDAGGSEVPDGGADAAEAATVAWQRLAANWASDHPWALIAVMTAIGFVLGAAIVASFAAGIGVEVDDLGLDVRDRVIVGASVLFFPLLIVLIYQPARSIRAAKWLQTPSSAVLGFLTGALIAWWIGLPPRWGVVVAALAAVMLIAPSLREPQRRRRQHRSEVPGRGFSALWYLAALVLGTSCLLWASWSYGRQITSERIPGGSVPVINFVLPTSRGLLTVADRTVCVDRIGEQIVVGDDSVTVVTSYDSFTFTDCERGDVAALFAPVADG